MWQSLAFYLTSILTYFLEYTIDIISGIHSDILFASPSNILSGMSSGPGALHTGDRGGGEGGAKPSHPYDHSQYQVMTYPFMAVCVYIYILYVLSCGILWNNNFVVNHIPYHRKSLQQILKDLDDLSQLRKVKIFIQAHPYQHLLLLQIHSFLGPQGVLKDLMDLSRGAFLGAPRVDHRVSPWNWMMIRGFEVSSIFP